MKLIQVSREHVQFKEIRNRHYVANHGCIGRQIHYLVFIVGEPLEKPAGIISGASAVWACAPRDAFFGIDKNNRQEKVQNIINNTVFRLEQSQKNLASMVLSQWRKQVAKDWKAKYGSDVIGFETFVFGQSRTGGIYRADNWEYVGQTKGTSRFSPDGRKGKTEHLPSVPKMVFCKLQ